MDGDVRGYLISPEPNSLTNWRFEVKYLDSLHITITHIN